MTETVFHERYCSRCGKEFIWNPDWVFRDGKSDAAPVFCSWSCLQAYKRSRPSSKAERRERVIQAILDGLTITEICALLNEEAAYVWYWKKKMEKDVTDDA